MGFVDKAYAEICDHRFCLHCSFAKLKNKHMGVLGINVATKINELATLVPSAGYTPTYDDETQTTIVQLHWPTTPQPKGLQHWKLYHCFFSLRALKWYIIWPISIKLKKKKRQPETVITTYILHSTCFVSSSNSNPVSYWVTWQINRELYTRTGQTVFTISTFRKWLKLLNWYQNVLLCL